MKHLLHTVAIFVMGFSVTAYAQNVDPMDDASSLYGAPYVVPGATVHKVQSHIVDQLYELRISVPGEYHSRPEKEYPVVYVLDGQWNFTMLADISGKLAYDGTVPEFIVVAITWGGEGDDPNVLRGRDFTPSSNPRIPTSGGASHFLRVLEEELIPYSESLYRADQRRVLVGSSLGGLFTSYAMLEQPELFDGYIALSAPYMLEQAYFDSRLAQLEGSQSLEGVRAYLAVGAWDFNQSQVSSFADALQKQNEGLDMHLQLVEGVGHAGVEPIGYTYGLQYVFQRPQLELPSSTLKRYVGTYENEMGIPPVTVSSHKGQLLLNQAGAPTLTFIPESETQFYVNGIDYSLSFVEQADGKMAFIINVQGAPFQFVRTCSKHKRQ